jgi:hypothetical protein
LTGLGIVPVELVVVQSAVFIVRVELGVDPIVRHVSDAKLHDRLTGVRGQRLEVSPIVAAELVQRGIDGRLEGIVQFCDAGEGEAPVAENRIEVASACVFVRDHGRCGGRGTLTTLAEKSTKHGLES